MMARRVRTGVALAGLVAALVALLALPPLGAAAPAWVWRFFVAWCVVTPYWHFVEYRWLRDPAQEQADLAYGQTLSRAVWAGVAAVVAVWLVRAR